jgi:hypothetical protein
VSQSLNDYISYVSDVLGAPKIFLPADETQTLEELEAWAHTRTGHWPEAGEIDLLILHLGRGILFHGESAELWEKMKSAMHLGSRRVLEIEASGDEADSILLKAFENYPASVALVLSATPSRESAMRTLGTSQVLQSFSPSTLIQSPDLKRTAWGDLQHVMRALGIKN